MKSYFLLNMSDSLKFRCMQFLQNAQEKCYSKPLRAKYLLALKSLRKYPLELESISDVMILNGFTVAMMKELQRSLTSNESDKENSTPYKQRTLHDFCTAKSTKTVFDLTLDDDDEPPAPAVRRKPAKPKKSAAGKRVAAGYRPRKGSGQYAAVLCLANGARLTRDQLTLLVQTSPYFSGKRFAWKGVAELMDRNLVRCVAACEYLLTEQGELLCARLQNALGGALQAQTMPANSVIGGTRDSIALDGGSITLIVDSREVSNHPRLELLLAERGVLYQVKTLTLADMLFVYSVPSERVELIVNLAAERKELTDFMSSFNDGRYREQKHRLKRSGIDKIVYLVEGRMSASLNMTSSQWDPRTRRYRRATRTIPTDNIQRAMMSTMANDEFIVHHCETIDETADYLAHVYRHLVDRASKPKRDWLYTDADGRVETLDAFNRRNAKSANCSAQALFAKQLMQVRGCSGAKASLIVNEYPTLGALLDAYESLQSQSDRELLLADLSGGNGEQRLGPALSKKICSHFNVF